jgi:hypothetical protein
MLVVGILVLLVVAMPLMGLWMVDRATSSVTLSDNEPAIASRGRRVALTAIILAVTAASIAYRALVDHGLQQTAALFIGLPVLLAITVIFTTSPRTATGVACKAVTVGMLVSVLFLWEGFLCVVMAAPLFYAVAIVISYGFDAGRRNKERRTRTLYSWLLIVAVAPMSLEGVTELTTVNRHESVTASKIVHASAAAISDALLAPPRFERGRPRPLFLRMGFPTPATSRIDRTPDRTRWVVEMRGGEMLLSGREARSGDLVLELEESRPGVVRWRAIADASHMTHFLTFRESIVEWEPIDAQTTRVTWTLRYDRGLDPSWYFGPMERYAARVAAGYLIDAVATP